jgi:hypothetical protein
MPLPAISEIPPSRAAGRAPRSDRHVAGERGMSLTERVAAPKHQIALVAEDSDRPAFLAEKGDAIRVLAKSVTHDVVEIGRHLSEVKERFGRGENPAFLAWAEDTLGWGQASIYKFVNVFKMASEGNFTRGVKLSDFNLSSLYLLAAPSTPDEVRTEIFERVKAGETVSVAGVKDAIAGAKAGGPEHSKTAIYTGCAEAEAGEEALARHKEHVAAEKPSVAPTVKDTAQRDFDDHVLPLLPMTGKAKPERYDKTEAHPNELERLGYFLVKVASAKRIRPANG